MCYVSIKRISHIYWDVNMPLKLDISISTLDGIRHNSKHWFENDSSCFIRQFTMHPVSVIPNIIFHRENSRRVVRTDWTWWYCARKRVYEVVKRKHWRERNLIDILCRMLRSLATKCFTWQRKAKKKYRN